MGELDQDALVRRLYDELRRQAERVMRGQGSGHTLQPTALVHEAFLRMAGWTDGRVHDDRHALRLTARVMRQVLVDHARRKGAARRGGGWTRRALLDGAAIEIVPDDELLALDEALDRLGDRKPRMADVVELRFFGGLSVQETAEALSVSPRTVEDDWHFARAWLRDELEPEP